MKNKYASLVVLGVLATVFGVVIISSAAGPVFYVGPFATDRTVCGTPYTFDVPGYTSVWLTQTKNGIQSYDGIYNVPSTYTGICNQDEGTYSTTVYSLINSAKANYIGSANFTIDPKTTPTPTPFPATPTPIPSTPTPITCSLAVTNSSGGALSNGQVYVGDRLIWKIYSSPFGYLAYWNGTKNGIQDVINSYSGYSSNTDWLTDPYPDGSQGSYTRYVSFKDSAGNVVCSTNTVSVSVVSPPPGTISFSQTLFNFNYTQGGQIPPHQSLTFTNSSNVNIAFTLKVTNQPSWLTTGYVTDQLIAYPNQPVGIGADVNPAGLSPGTYTTAITVTGNFTTSPFNIPITLVVAPATTPTITLLTPNGGEIMKAGGNNFQLTYHITNFQNLVAPAIDFELIQNGATVGKMLANLIGVYADQIYWNFSWQPGLHFGSLRTTSQYVFGSGFKVRVLLYNNSGANLVSLDESDGTFSIPTPLPATPAPTPTPIPFFSQGSFETTSVTCGSTYTFSVKNHTSSQVWLIQTKNTLISYNNTYNIPTTYTSVCGRDEGSYTNKVYSVVNGGIGNYLGSVNFEIKPSATTPTTPVTIIAAGLSAGTPYGTTAKPGDINIRFSNFTFTSNANEGYYIEQFGVKGNPLSHLPNNVKFVTISYIDKSGQSQKTSGAVTSQGTVSFAFFGGSSGPYIPKGGSLGIDISADIRTKAEGAVSGSVFSIDLDPTVFKAIGETSGNVITSINSQSGLKLTIVDPINTSNPTPVFYRGSFRVTSAVCGESYVFTVDNYSNSAVWLVQTKNGQSRYNDVYTIPKTETSVCSQDEGIYNNQVYSVINGQKGNYLGTVNFEVKYIIPTTTPTLPTNTPSAPFNLTVASAVAIDGTVKLYWENVDGEKFYIYKNKNDGAFQFLAVATDKFYKDVSGLGSDIKYGYYVTAVNGYGESQPSNKVYIYPTTNTTFGTPTFYLGTFKSDSAICGQRYTFSVDGYNQSQIWLVQTKNGNQSFNGIYTIPTSYTSLCNRDEGLYSNAVYTIINGQKGNYLGTVNFEVKPIVPLPSVVVPVIPTKLYDISEIQDGDLIRGQGDIAVWIVKIVGEKRYKRWLFGPQIFNAYGHLGFNKVKNISKETLNQFDTVVLIRLYSEQRVFELSDFVPGIRAIRRWVPDAQTFLERGFDFDSVYIINENEFKLYPEGQSLPTSGSGTNGNVGQSAPSSANISEAMKRFLGF